MALYGSLLDRAGPVSNAPYVPYSGEEVAPINAEQAWGANNINQSIMGFWPYSGNAGQMINNAGQMVTAGDINTYMDPYTQSVIDATQRDYDVQNKRAQSAVTGNAAAQGALGGDRVGVAQALTQEAQERVQAPTIANLRSQAFQSAEQMANIQKQRELASGVSMSQQDLANANAAFAVGTAEQQTQQAKDTQDMTDYYQAQGYPFATAQWMAQLILGTGSQMGSSTYTQGPQPNQWLQGAGLGIAGLGALGQAGGSAGIGAFLPLLAASDKRLKENIKEIGKLHDGQKIYRYNFKGDPTTHVGLLSQEVEKKHPHAVHKIAGFGAVDYDEATKDAIRKWSGGAIKGYFGGGAPGGSGKGSFPAYDNPAVGGPIGSAPPSDNAFVDAWSNPMGTGTSPGVAPSNQSVTPSSPFTPPSPALSNLNSNLFGQGTDVALPPSAPPPPSTPPPLGLGGLLPPTPSTPPSAWSVPSGNAFVDAWGGAPMGPVGGPIGGVAPRARGGFAAGGNPYGPAGQGWVPTVGNISGSPLAAPKAPNMLNPQSDTSKGMAKGLADAIKAAKGTGPSPTGGSGYNWDTDPSGGQDQSPEGSYPYAYGGMVKRKGLAGGGVPISSGWAGGLNGDLPEEDLSDEPPIRYGGTWDRATDDTAHKLAEAEGDVPSPVSGFAPDTEGPVAAAAKKIIRPATGSDFPDEGDTEDMSARSRLAARGVAPQDDPEARRSAFNQALMSLGFGMMAQPVGGRGSFLAGVGRGGEQAMGTYASSLAATAAQRAQERKEAFERERFEAPYQRQTVAERLREQHQNIQERLAAERDARAQQANERAEKREERNAKTQELLLDPTSGLSPKVKDAMAADLHGKEFLDALDPVERNIVEAAGNYDIHPTQALSKLKGTAERKMALIRQYNPDYDQNYFTLKGTALKNFYASTSPNSPVVQARAYNTAVGHSGDLAEALSVIQKTNPGIMLEAQKSGTPILSYLAAQARQRAAKGTPEGEAWNVVNAIAPLYVAETTKFYSGSTGSLEEKKAIGAPLDPNLSYPELIGALRAQSHMFRSKTAPMEQEFKDVMDAPGLKEYGTKKNIREWHATKENAQRSLDTIERLYQETHVPAGGGNVPTPPLPPPNERVIGKSYTNPKNGVTKTWTAAGWE